VPEPSAEEPVAFPEDLLAVCLDANSMSRGRLNLDAIEDLLNVIESQELDVQIWVPEPVVWEWSEHLAAALTEARTNYEDARGQTEAAGVPELVGGDWAAAVPVDGVAAGIYAALEDLDGVTVLTFAGHPELAVEGLRDQVLLRAPGRKKGNVKTGAADSSSFRLALLELSRYGGTMVVVSGDQDAARHFTSKPSVVLVNSLSRAKAGIVAMRTGSEIALERVREAVQSRLPYLLRAELGAPEVDGVGVLDVDGHLRGRVVESNVELVAIDHVVAIDEVEVSQSEGYGTAMVDALVSVERELQVLSDVNEMIEMDVETFDGLRAGLEVSAESHNGIDWDIVVDKVHLS
jgi:hypothetical protein